MAKFYSTHLINRFHIETEVGVNKNVLNNCILDGLYYSFIPKVVYMPRKLDKEYEVEYELNMEKLEPFRQYLELEKHNNEVSMKIQKIEEECEDLYGCFNKIEQLKSQLKKIPLDLCEGYSSFKLMERPSAMNSSKLHDYYELTEFNKGMMLNVSPNWKGGKGSDLQKVAFLERVIDIFYNNIGRFSKCRYVIENGHDKDQSHIHAHIVLEFEPGMIKGTMTAFKKGRLNTEFRNCWNRRAKTTLGRVTGKPVFAGLVDHKISLQYMLIGNQTIMNDKLDYLIEDKKPYSHKNVEHSVCPRSGSFGDEF